MAEPVMDAEVGGAVGRHQIQPGDLAGHRRRLVRERQRTGRGPGAYRRRGGDDGALAGHTGCAPERLETPATVLLRLALMKPEDVPRLDA